MVDMKNIFSAFRFEDDEAVISALRADLADIVRGFIERSQLTQKALEKRLGIPQSTISAIKPDRIDHLSIESFLRILTRAGIPWTAKCWKPPHDAAWIAGGLAHFLANMTAQQTALILPPSDQGFWLTADQAGFADYKLAGAGVPEETIVLDASHQNVGQPNG